ncbi:MAG: Signal recognition particle receptor FtsY [Alphaproteobacteria bacterium MarineAlpha5_Bin5]|nr:MAG: Signal recognition particle receptor FtsY [Alphaproteobacteria bacterium MarineAlpha5_Bin5]PPR52520.1 MAG: Signal recognition particle receptor FtsY [Alphaproteobacteria bacterium MarineAlpha5_Bin4]|tara:strand:+ start:200 stop:1114 length:915 start_codon:yes stop_codon:yes gene_type:complete
MSLFSYFKKNLNKTSNFLSSSISSTFQNKKVDAETLEELESILISADISIEVVSKLIDSIRKVNMSDNNISKIVFETLAAEIEKILKPKEQLLINKNNSIPNILLFVGVNGSGKTTTIGKIASKIGGDKKILIAACDTFRAAAVDQLKTWAEKNKNEFFKGKLNQDPASVAYKATEKFINEKYDYLIVDTAGRLSNNTNLINQLVKIKNVIGKIIDANQIKTILVLDGTNGSNMIKQAEIFSQTLGVSGIIITKLDGTAKGGALISIANKYEIPINYVGLGENVEDLAEFSSKTYSRSILNLGE